jgi:hypothetical protein
MEHEVSLLRSQDVAVSIYSDQDESSPLYYTSSSHISKIRFNIILPSFSCKITVHTTIKYTFFPSEQNYMSWLSWNHQVFKYPDDLMKVEICSFVLNFYHYTQIL